MGILEKLVAKAQKKQATVALPEIADPRVLEAAKLAEARGIAKIVLVGSAEDVAEAAAAADFPADRYTVFDPNDGASLEKAVAAYRREYPDVPEKRIRRKARDPLGAALVLLGGGGADAAVAGAAHSTEEVVFSALDIIGIAEASALISSITLMTIPGFDGPEQDSLVFTDCGLNPNPTPTELAEIGIAGAGATERLLGWTPRVAFLSYSSVGSADHPDVRKVTEALAEFRRLAPDILAGGEYQLDTALVPEVAAAKIDVESDPVAGRANVLVFPDLDAANIAYKAAQRFSAGLALGPFLQGFRRTVADLSRGASVEDIVGAIALAAVDSRRG